MENIPLIIPVFNQLTYLRNLVNWWKWYHPENPIYIIDNGSNYLPLLKYYDDISYDVFIIRYNKNDFRDNLKDTVGKVDNDYYVISDPDIMPHPATPPYFLRVFKAFIEKGYHHVGFNLITRNLPEWLNEREMIIGNEAHLLEGKKTEVHGDFNGYKAPIDTTFALYKKSNGGWSSPMNGKDWGNSLRIFEAFHLGWYIDGDNLNDEMKHYFETAKYRVPGKPSAGSNNNRPKQYQ